MLTAKPNGDGFRRYLYQNVDNIRGYPIRRIGGGRMRRTYRKR